MDLEISSTITRNKIWMIHYSLIKYPTQIQRPRNNPKVMAVLQIKVPKMCKRLVMNLCMIPLLQNTNTDRLHIKNVTKFQMMIQQLLHNKMRRQILLHKMRLPQIHLHKMRLPHLPHKMRQPQQKMKPKPKPTHHPTKKRKAKLPQTMSNILINKTILQVLYLKNQPMLILILPLNLKKSKKDWQIKKRNKKKDSGKQRKKHGRKKIKQYLRKRKQH